ncbi:MAG: S8 family serine peptidase [Lentisphaeraceae bacterium]|nr:S8 family serine peptidase [Lentisphaeraceae bacterium]
MDAGASRNILFVAAAGNSGRDIDSSPAYPAAYSSSNIITVAATDRNDNLASFSNYGINNTDIGAPGVSIYSTSPNNGYRYLSGTSMAAPHVSGAAVLLKAVDSSMSVADLKSALMEKADVISSLAGKVASNGRLNINNSLNAEDTPDPAQITSPLNGSEFTTANITFTWVNADVSEIQFKIGSSFGASDLYSNDNLNGATSVSVTLPEDGRRIYARLSSYINNEWVHKDSAYVASDTDVPAPVKSELTSPASGTVLKSGTINFEWNTGSQVARRWMYVGTRKGYGNLYSGNVGETGADLILTFFGTKAYVRLWSLLEGRWQYNDYSFETLNGSSAITSPANTSTLSNSSVTFEWTEGYNISHRYLMIGSQKAARNHYSSYVSGTSKVVNIPTDGSTIYVRLWSRSAGRWFYHDYSYKAPLIAPEASVLNSHEQGATFNSEDVTLTWTDGVGVKYNYLYIYANNSRKRIFSGMVYNNSKTITVPSGCG